MAYVFRVYYLISIVENSISHTSLVDFMELVDFIDLTCLVNFILTDIINLTSSIDFAVKIYLIWNIVGV